MIGFMSGGYSDYYPSPVAGTPRTSMTCSTCSCLVVDGEESVVAFNEFSYGDYVKADSGGTLRAVGGAIGGGSETLVLVRGSYVANSNGQGIVGALAARDFKGVGNEYVAEGKVVVLRA